MKRFLIIAAMVAAVAIPSASALQSMQVNPASPSYGQAVTFSYQSARSGLRIAVQCYPATAPEADFDQVASSPFVMSGWDGSSARCDAALYYLQGARQHLVASMTFNVSP